MGNKICVLTISQLGENIPSLQIRRFKNITNSSQTSKLLETQYMDNVVLDTAFKTHGSTAAFDKSNSAKAVVA